VVDGQTVIGYDVPRLKALHDQGLVPTPPPGKPISTAERGASAGGASTSRACSQGPSNNMGSSFIERTSSAVTWTAKTVPFGTLVAVEREGRIEGRLARSRLPSSHSSQRRPWPCL